MANVKTENEAGTVRVEITGQTAEILRSQGIEVRPGQQMIVRVDDGQDPAIILKPGTMNKLEASQELKRQYLAEEAEQTFNKTFEGRHFKEVLVAATRAFKEVLGSIHGVKNFFGPSPTEIEVTVDLQNGRAVTERAFYGDLLVSAFEDAQAKIRVNGSSVVSININAKKKYGKYISTIFSMIEEQLLSNSIYMGRAVVVTKGNEGPDFNLTELRVNDKIFLNTDEELIVSDYIVSELGTGGKRVFLFTGPYGNAKTETAMRIAAEALKQNMTFFYVKDAQLFPEMLKMTRLYGPSVVFLEDVDEIAGSDNRDATMNLILNTLDGVELKGHNLRVLLTTNHIEKINEAARRPGRIDIIRQFNNPSIETKVKIFTSYFEKLNGFEDLNLEEISEVVGDISGASVAEIAKRATIQAQKYGKITNDIVRGAFASMEYHLKLMAGSAPKEGNTIDNLIEKVVTAKLEPLASTIEKMAKVVL